MDWLLSPSTCMIKNDCRNFYIVNLSLNIDTWFQVPLYFMPCLILFHDRPASFQLIPLRRVELLKYPHYKRFSGDLEVSSKISVSCEKSNFNMNLWNDRVQCISTKWCKKEHVLYIYLYIPAIKCETFIEYTCICLIHVFHMLTIIFYYSNICWTYDLRVVQN